MTMPTNPIAAAAEEIAGFFRTLGPPTDDTLAHDTKVVAQILTRHFAPAAATDEGQVTEEWLRGLGFIQSGEYGLAFVHKMFEDEQDGHKCFFHLECSDYMNLPDCPWEVWNIHSDNTPNEGAMIPVSPKTRNDVLRLLTALGIVPRE